MPESARKNVSFGFRDLREFDHAAPTTDLTVSRNKAISTSSAASSPTEEPASSSREAEVEHLESNKKKRPWNDQTVLAIEEGLTELEQEITDLERQPQKKAKSPSAMAFTTTDDIPAGTLTLTLNLITNLHDGHWS